MTECELRGRGAVGGVGVGVGSSVVQLKATLGMFLWGEFILGQDGMYALGKAHIRALSQKFPQRRLSNGSNVRLIDDGPLASFQGRSSGASSSNASLLQAIDGVMSLALCPQVVSQASR